MTDLSIVPSRRKRVKPAAVEPQPVASAREWSSLQSAIFDWFASGAGHLLVRARAGTGKTTTIIEGVSRAPERSILLAAFNKSIAEELSTRLRPPAIAKTLHSVGFGCIMRFRKTVNVDGNRARRLLELAYDNAPGAIIDLAARLAGLGKDIKPMCAGAMDLAPIAEAFEIEPEEELEKEGWTVQVITEMAYQCMLDSLEDDGTIDFSDMIYVPLRHGWVTGKYDLVCIDEAQDMNTGQIMLAQRSCREGGRIAVIGDDRQAIYGFRGADSGSLDRLKDSLKAQELGLKITYRCGTEIVRIARNLCPDFEAGPNNPPGAVIGASLTDLYSMIKPGAFVLSRLNAPLPGICLRLLRKGVKAHIQGRDVGKGLLLLVRRVARGTISETLDALEEWADKQIERAKKKGGKTVDMKISSLMDQAETLAGLSDGLSTAQELVARIEHLFTDIGGPGSVMCSTVHKSKGLEADQVFILEDSFRFEGAEEDNIRYVALTRAKSELYLVRK